MIERKKGTPHDGTHTPPSRQRVNRRISMKRLERLMARSFRAGDVLYTLHFDLKGDEARLWKWCGWWVRTIAHKVINQMPGFGYIYAIQPAARRVLFLTEDRVPKEELIASWTFGRVDAEEIQTADWAALAARFTSEIQDERQPWEANRRSWSCSRSVSAGTGRGEL